MKYLLGSIWQHLEGDPIRVLDVGSQVSHEGEPSYRDIVRGLPRAAYTGMDVEAGANVDVVATQEYVFPFETESFDVVLSGQAFEHIEFPWLTMREIARVLRPGGVAVVIAPSSGPEHKYPRDCWRFYADGMRAFAKWASLDCVGAITNWRETSRFMWGDTVGVFHKPQRDGGTARMPQVDLAGLKREVFDRAPPSILPPKPQALRRRLSLRVATGRSALMRSLDRHLLWRFRR
jgi:SAM-dependent methyltransferase